LSDIMELKLKSEEYIFLRPSGAERAWFERAKRVRERGGG